MKQPITTVFLMLSLLLPSACATPAAEDQLAQMCKHVIDLKGKVNDTPVEERIAQVEAEYKAKADLLKSQEARDIKGWEDALAAQLAEVDKAEVDKAEVDKTDPDVEEPVTEEQKEAKREALRARYAARKEETTKQYAVDLGKLEPRKASDIRAAQVRAKEDLEKASKLFHGCIAKYKKANLSEEIAKCRTAATTIPELEACK